MKLSTVLFSSVLVATTFSANAGFGDFFSDLFGSSEKPATEKVEVAAAAVKDNATEVESAATQSNGLVDFASEQLGLSKEVTSGALGAVFKVAKDNLAGDSFASISDAIPGLDGYIDSAPSEVKSSLGGLASSLGDSDEVKAIASLGYLDSAFETLGVPKETILPVVNTVTNYLEQNDFGTAAAMLKKGVNFL